MTKYVFSKEKFEKDLDSWGTDKEKNEYAEDIKDPEYWVNFCDGKIVDIDTMSVTTKYGLKYFMSEDWCEFRKEN